MKTLKVKIDPTGTRVQMEADGFTGSGCRDATEPYLRKLGLSPEDVHEELKPEFQQEQSIEQSLGE